MEQKSCMDIGSAASVNQTSTLSLCPLSYIMDNSDYLCINQLLHICNDILSQNMMFQHCINCNMTSFCSVVMFHDISSQNMMFQDCISCNATSFSSLVMFQVVSGQNVKFQDCINCNMTNFCFYKLQQHHYRSKRSQFAVLQS